MTLRAGASQDVYITQKVCKTSQLDTSPASLARNSSVVRRDSLRTRCGCIARAKALLLRAWGLGMHVI